jgi:hypothetical protein
MLLFSIYETWSRPPGLDPDTAVDKINQNTANIMDAQTEADVPFAGLMGSLSVE